MRTLLLGVVVLAAVAPRSTMAAPTADDMHAAVKAGNAAHVRLMLKQNRKLANAPDEKGRYPIYHVAIERKSNIEVAKALLEAGANPNRLDRRGHLPLIAAVSVRHVAMVELLIKYKANVNAKQPENDRTPLHQAVYTFPNRQIVKALIKAGADVNVQDAAGNSPYDIARGWYDHSILELFPKD
jgi:uncharacterized protein